MDKSTDIHLSRHGRLESHRARAEDSFRELQIDRRNEQARRRFRAGAVVYPRYLTGRCSQAVLALGLDTRDDETSRLSPWRPTLKDVCDANKAILDAYEHPEYYRLRDRGFLEKALSEALSEHELAGDNDGAIRAASMLLHGIARAQSFGDGNHRTALVVAQTYLANNDLGHLTSLGVDDLELTEHVEGTGIKSTPATHGPEDTAMVLRARLYSL